MDSCCVDLRKCEYCGQTTPSDQFNRYGTHDYCFYDRDRVNQVNYESTINESGDVK